MYKKSFAQLGPVGDHVIGAHVVSVIDDGDELFLVVVVVPYK